jgi:hypothetical protein
MARIQTQLINGLAVCRSGDRRQQHTGHSRCHGRAVPSDATEGDHGHSVGSVIQDGLRYVSSRSLRYSHDRRYVPGFLVPHG